MTRFDSISDDELHSTVRRLTARSNLTLADLLAHLGEVEARGIHRERACASLYAYCIYELRMSEDAAFRRAKAARLVREHPELHAMMAKGELHLTGLLMLAPLLGGEHHGEALARARFRTKREIAKLIARLDPKPAVAPSIEPLGPSPGRATYAAFIESLCGPVRELRVGDRPEDWLDDGDESEADGERSHDEVSERAGEVASRSHDGGPPHDEHHETPTDPSARPLHYKIQFTASQDYIQLVDEAFNLLGHAPSAKELPELYRWIVSATGGISSRGRRPDEPAHPARVEASMQSLRFASPEGTGGWGCLGAARVHKVLGRAWCLYNARRVRA